MVYLHSASFSRAQLLRQTRVEEDDETDQRGGFLQRAFWRPLRPRNRVEGDDTRNSRGDGVAARRREREKTASGKVTHHHHDECATVRTGSQARRERLLPPERQKSNHIVN